MEAAPTPPPTLVRRLLPGRWTRQRVIGEAVLVLLLSGFALVAAAETGHGALRVTAEVLAVAVLTLLRLGLPATTLVLAGAAGAGLEGSALVLICASWSAGWRIEKAGRATAAFAASFALHFAIFIAIDPLMFSMAGDLALNAVYFLGMAIGPGLISRYRAQRTMLLLTLRKHNDQLLRERALIAGQVRMRERNRIAQDMHDSLGHQLALIAVHTGALQVDTMLNERQREAVGVLRDASVLAMHELREVVGLLREDLQDVPPERPSPPADGVAGVERLVESSRAAGFPVELRRYGRARPLGAATEQAAYRIAQEGLTNVHKHAPGAEVTVTLRYEPDSLLVEVANGPATQEALVAAGQAVSGGHGLVGLEERARLVGGMLHSGPTTGGGFRLAGVLPYGPEPGPTPAAGLASLGAVSSDGAAGASGDATFVGARDDFRRQTEESSLGDGGPVIDRAELSREFHAIMSSKKNVASGCAIAFSVLLVGGTALAGWGLYALIGEVEKATVTPAVYRSVHVGDATADVESVLPEGSSLLTEDLDGQGPQQPKGASCRLFYSSVTAKEIDKENVFRFCFKDGELVEKKSFKVAMF